MPELPEVETIVRGLRRRVIDREIVSLKVLEKRSIQFEKALITEVIAGYKISSIWRRAKVMIWDLSSQYSLLFHLKMTGQIIIDQPSEDRFSGGHPTASMGLKSKLPDNTTRAVFQLEDGAKIYFNDQRKFGWIKLLPTKAVHSDEFLSTVGPEHDSDSFTRQYFWDKIKNRITPVKAVLLDQKIVAGIGNIYADEALHMAMIHPARKASSLPRKQVNSLFESIIRVLKDGVDRGGTSFTTYVNADGARGDYLLIARVFRREGQDCRVCGGTIVKTRVAGRGTHYCPVCQPVPRSWRP
ncbi:MAG TPA: bifunctional DNA-formamidopyrimidine glycosylase/DNA-(apurinic or apyrimidinic site) lyase [Candidatus Saccharimonadales bacterium]